MVAAPLIAGNDLRNMTPEIREILTNKELIGINQDSAGKQGKRIRKEGDMEVWVKDLSGKRKAVALLNRSSQHADIKVDWEEIGFKGRLKVRDLWLHKDLGRFNKFYQAKDIPGHGVMVLLVEK
jgi:alpha-galactosidase